MAKSQAEATGKSLAFGDNFAMTDAGAIYPGVRFIRTAVLLNESLILFVDRVTADKPHTFDLATHIAGAWGNLLGDLPPGDHMSPPPYEYLRDSMTLKTSDSITLAHR